MLLEFISVCLDSEQVCLTVASAAVPGDTLNKQETEGTEALQEQTDVGVFVDSSKQ